APVACLDQADELEELTALACTACRAREPLVQLEHLVGRVPAREAEQLGEVAQPAACGQRAGAGAADLGSAARRAHEAAGDLHERGPARPVPPGPAGEPPVGE